jgi:polyhydroxyalkanoate synthesis regulator phasin
MTEEPIYKMKKVIDGNIIKYRKVEVTPSDIIAEKDLEIKRLHELIDTLREQITQLEQEKQRYQLRDAPMDSAESYQIYK